MGVVVVVRESLFVVCLSGESPTNLQRVAQGQPDMLLHRDTSYRDKTCYFAQP